MKILFNILSTVLVLLMFSCQQKTVKEIPIAEAQDTLKNRMKENEALKNKAEMEEGWQIDSVRLSTALDHAIVIAQKILYTGKTYTEFEQTIDSVFHVKTKIERGTFFSPAFEHLVIRREAPNNVLIDIYLIQNRKMTHVLGHDQWALTYVSDTLKDVNGDGYKDYVLNWYGSNGCCLKGFSDVYIYQFAKGTFTDQFEFINPTFSPKEKTVRGVCYGHPGETEMYTYKWKGETIDTIEYLAYEKDTNDKKTGKFITSKEQRFDDTLKIIKRLGAVPEEYTSLDGYDWFMGDGYE